MKKIRCHRHNKYYEYKETREGGSNGAFSSLTRGHYHFYKCPHGCIFAESSERPIRTEGDKE